MFWEHNMFSSISKFHVLTHVVPHFTNLSIELFPSIADSSSELPSTNLELGPLTDPALPVDLALILLVDPTTASPLVSPSPPPHMRCSTRVTQPFVRLRNFHCYSTIYSLYEPRIPCGQL